MEHELREGLRKCKSVRREQRTGWTFFARVTDPALLSTQHGRDIVGSPHQNGP